MRRFSALILICAVFLSFAACGGGESVADPAAKTVVENADKVVMSYKGHTLKSGMYAFIFSALKTDYLHLLQLHGKTDFVEDTVGFWTLGTESGKTFAKAVTDDINTHCKMLLICGEMASEYSISPDAAAMDEAAAEYNGYVTSYGGETELEVYLSRYGISRKELSAYLKDKQTIAAVRNKMCSAGGPCELSSKDVYGRINSDYAKAKHIFLSDDKNGGKAFEKAGQFLSEIRSGKKSFEDFAGFSDDGSASGHPDGFLVAADETEERYAAAVFGLKTGECAVCEAESGAYLVMRVSMTDTDRKALYGKVWKKAADEKFSAYLAERCDLVELNSEELDKYDIVTADVLQ